MKKKIILIEDDQDACTLFKYVLQHAGFEVSHHHDGHFVFNTQYETPDLYILDNCLPSIDGVAITKYLKIKHRSQNIPILVMSANHAIKGKTKKAGASAFIAKPFDANHFVQLVQKLLHDHSVVQLSK